MSRARVVIMNSALGALDYRVPQGMAVEPCTSFIVALMKNEAESPEMRGGMEAGNLPVTQPTERSSGFRLMIFIKSRGN